MRSLSKHRVRVSFPFIFAASVALVLTGCQPTYKTMPEVGAAQPGEMVLSLTFDDGPSPTYTPQVLDVLARRGVKATFFVTGENAARYPHLINRMVAEGHSVASHTWNHPRLTNLSSDEVASQVSRTHAELARHGVAVKCVRPPYMLTDPRIQQLIYDNGAGSKTMLWSVDSDDWRGHPSSVIANNVISGFHPGAVILMHDGGGNRGTTVGSLDAIIDAAQAQGYTFGTICK